MATLAHDGLLLTNGLYFRIDSTRSYSRPFYLLFSICLYFLVESTPVTTTSKSNPLLLLFPRPSILVSDRSRRGQDHHIGIGNEFKLF